MFAEVGRQFFARWSPAFLRLTRFALFFIHVSSSSLFLAVAFLGVIAGFVFSFGSALAAFASALGLGSLAAPFAFAGFSAPLALAVFAAFAFFFFLPPPCSARSRNSRIACSKVTLCGSAPFGTLALVSPSVM